MKNPIGLQGLLTKGGATAAETLIQSKAARRWLLRRADRMLARSLQAQNFRHMPERMVHMRRRAVMNLLYTLDHGIERGTVGRRVLRSLLSTFIRNVLLGEEDRMQPFYEKFGRYPPTFLTISPTKRCNLQCNGCYAGSTLADRSTLDYEVLTRLLKEKRQEWGSHFSVISGGEPLTYRSRGRQMLDVVAEHPDEFFMMYTNGTLITEAVAERMAQLGNISPAISVEGWEAETDEYRGAGVFRKITEAMERLRRHGVPFGISVTATSQNAETVLSDEFIDYFYDEQGALYSWIFQYMPIGRSYTMDRLVTPEQRKWMLEREMKLFYEKNRFVVDFWNSGALSFGCIAAGRSGGFFYVDWDGNLSPCVFFPYAVDNLYDMYERGDTITSVLETDYFKRIRAWQDAYRGDDGEKPVRNLFIPCPIRDHYDIAKRIVGEHHVKPIDGDAQIALEDPEYHRGMKDYGERIAVELDPMWEKMFPPQETVAQESTGEKQRIPG